METPHLQRGALNFYPDPVKRREQVIAIGIGSTGNGRNPIINGGRQPSCGGTSRMNREVHVRICERLRVQFPGATRQSLADLPLVMTSKTNRTRQLIENSAAREGARLDVRLELESPETLQQLLLSGRIYGLLPYSSIYHGAQTRRLAAVPIRGLAITRYLAKSRNEVSSTACETLEKAVLSEMRELARRLGARERQ